MIKEKRKHSSLEREVIIALTLLYLIIMGAVLGLHFGMLHYTAPPPPAQELPHAK